MMTRACNSNSKRARQEDGELRASLGCTVNSRLTRATSGNSLRGKEKHRSLYGKGELTVLASFCDCDKTL